MAQLGVKSLDANPRVLASAHELLGQILIRRRARDAIGIPLAAERGQLREAPGSHERVVLADDVHLVLERHASGIAELREGLFGVLQYLPRTEATGRAVIHVVIAQDTRHCASTAAPRQLNNPASRRTW